VTVSSSQSILKSTFNGGRNYLQAFLNMMATILKFMFVYNQIMILDDKSVKKCACDFAATLTRSNINLEFVYLCISSKDFAPILSCKPTMYWYKLNTWRFPVVSRQSLHSTFNGGRNWHSLDRELSGENTYSLYFYIII
jgi:hypothetical protein